MTVTVEIELARGPHVGYVSRVDRRRRSAASRLPARSDQDRRLLPPPRQGIRMPATEEVARALKGLRRHPRPKAVAWLVPAANGETDLGRKRGGLMRAAPTDVPVLAEAPGFTSRLTHCGEVDVAVENLAGGRDSTELFRRAFSDGRCQVPHWGYLVKGRMRVRYPDHEEVISAGEVWYMPPGHIPTTEEDVENIVFTLAGEYEKLMVALAKGMGAGNG